MKSCGRRWGIATVLVVFCLTAFGCMTPEEDYVREFLQKEKESVQKKEGKQKEGRQERAEFLSSLDADQLTEKGLKVLWRHNLGQVSQKASNLWHTYRSGDRFVIETLDGLIFYFNAQSGVWQGTTALESGLWEKPVIRGKQMYVINGRGILTIDLPTGSIKAHAPISIPVMSPPIYKNKTLLIGGGNGTVSRFDLKTGGSMWKESAQGSVRTPIIATDTMVYASGYEGRVMAIDLATGVAVWSFRPASPASITSGPVLLGDRLYVGGKRGYLYALSATDGIVLEKFPCGAPVSKAPVAVGTKLLVFTYKSGVKCLNTDEKLNVQWQHSEATRLISRGSRGLYLETRDGQIVCLDEETGKEKWSIEMPDGLLISSNPDEAPFYLASPEGQVVAIGELD